MDLVERVAKALHDGWMRLKWDAGFRYGPLRGENVHPHLVEWHKLDDTEAQNQDRFQAALILHAYANGELVKESDLPKAIHNAWVVWQGIHREEHEHAAPYVDAHKKGPAEHAEQAKLVWRVLQAQCAQIPEGKRTALRLIAPPTP